MSNVIFVFVKENADRATVYVRARGVYLKEVEHQLKEITEQVRRNIDLDGVSVQITDHQRIVTGSRGCR